MKNGQYLEFPGENGLLGDFNTLKLEVYLESYKKTKCERFSRVIYLKVLIIKGKKIK